MFARLNLTPYIQIKYPPVDSPSGEVKVYHLSEKELNYYRNLPLPEDVNKKHKKEAYNW